MPMSARHRVEAPDHAILSSDLLRCAEAALRHRDSIREAFGADADLFHDPAWLILIDMLVQRVRGRTVSVGSAAIASGVPNTTALRWITLLVERGLIARTEDLADRRRTLLTLTDKGLKRLERSFPPHDRTAHTG